MPNISVVATRKETDLCVVGVVVAEASGEPGTCIVEGRGDEATTSCQPTR